MELYIYINANDQDDETSWIPSEWLSVRLSV